MGKILADIAHNWYYDGKDPLATVKKLVGVAKRGGADGVVIPGFRAELVYREKEAVQRTRKYELPLDIIDGVADIVRDHDLELWATPYYPEIIEIFQDIRVDGYRLENGDLRHDGIVHALAATNRKVLVAVGLYGFEETELPFSVFDDGKVVVMHSTGGMPTHAENGQIGKILSMVANYWDKGIDEFGLDSTYAIPAMDILAMGFGLDYLVRQIKLDEKAIGSRWAVDENELKQISRIFALAEEAVKVKTALKNLTDADLAARKDRLRDPDDFLLPCNCG